MLPLSLRIRCFVPLCARWTIVQGPDSKRDGRALSAPLGHPSEVFRYLGSGIGSTADDGAKETAEVGVGFDTQGSLSERQGSFGAQGSVVGQKIHPGMSQYREQFRFQAQAVEIAAIPASCRFHVTSMPGPSSATPSL